MPIETKDAWARAVEIAANPRDPAAWQQDWPMLSRARFARTLSACSGFQGLRGDFLRTRDPMVTGWLAGSSSSTTIAAAENSLYRSTSPGARTITAPQLRHGIRLYTIVTSPGSAPTSSGPHCWRPLTPCPTTVSGCPGHWLTTP